MRLDYKAKAGPADPETLIAHLAYGKKMAADTELVAGSFGTDPVGMIVFKADHLAAAQAFCDHDPIIRKGYDTVRLYEWRILINSIGQEC